ncbi:unnamed protein product [Paramecium sonneborni]|uniref:non-specific serine/threonine protein kinase n=1 Tax=Paramecium sonneborni TaxID=65129 RepID=A0A8S1NDK8_9CILI|nr:unnamed protein product [Paramecium sonneborni]
MFQPNQSQIKYSNQFGATSAVYFSQQQTSRDKPIQTRDGSENKQLLQFPASQIVYGPSMKFNSPVQSNIAFRKTSKELNITIEDPSGIQQIRQPSPNIKKQREQMEKDWNKLIDKSKTLQENLVMLKNNISINLNKKQSDQRLIKESPSTAAGLSSRMKLQKVNVTCKLNSPFKAQPNIEVCKNLSHNALANLKFTTNAKKNPIIINNSSAINYVNMTNNYAKNLLDDHQQQKVSNKSLIQKQTNPLYIQIENKLKLKISSFLGRGKFSDVHMAIDNRTGLIFALKIIKKQTVIEHEMQEQLAREIVIQSKLSHPNIVKMFGQSYDQQYIYMMLEFCNNGELFQHQYKQQNKRFSEKEASHFIMQILSAIQYMHKQGFMHRDLKTENILLSLNYIKLCDLGCVREIPKFEDRRNTFCGTVDYIAPEVIKDEGYDERCDAWQIAILAYELVAGDTPFSEFPRDDEIIMANILKNKFNLPNFFSPALKDFVNRGLQQSPDHRISIDQMLLHRWIADNNKVNHIEYTF